MNAGEPKSNEMPAAEVDVTVALVRGLLESQHPDLASLELVEVANGWDNVMFRLGSDYMVRLPRRQVAAILIEHEQAWLPGLAASLTLPIPAPMRIGVADAGFPWPWSVLPWFDGCSFADDPPANMAKAASTLGGFVASLQRRVADAPINPFRGVPISDHDERVQIRIAELADAIDAPAVRRLWAELLSVPEWEGEPMLLHGDLHPLNALTNNGELSAVIDFGDITSGDPAADYLSAWLFFDVSEHGKFRSALANAGAVNDNDTWQRGRAAALSWCLAVLTRSADNPTLHRISSRGLERVLQSASRLPLVWPR